ncbi:MAG: DUF2493 domain-containing protein [Ruminococcaceae bacterium]|nr:DUF2493 domain-containing protein [Oscillospiraceae bacterium]
MKLAIIGSRSIHVDDIGKYIPKNTTEIVSGGAKGVDTCAAEYATELGIKLTVFLPEYKKFGISAPLKRNLLIAEYSDQALAFWDGSSKGTLYTINAFKSLGKHVDIITILPQK